MARNNQKKPNYPSKTCPKCGKLIHARSMKHEECGWHATGNAHTASAAAPVRKGRKPARAKSAEAGITLQEIEVVKAIVDRLGVTRVQHLAEVLAK
jgi:hypothetical protein